MRIVVFETEKWEHQACLRLAPQHEVHCLREALDEGNASAYGTAEVISTFVNSRLSAAVLSRLPRLRLIATRSTGYDHIDLGYCSKHGISVCNVPDYGDATVAEHTFALMLAAVRNIVTASHRTRRGDFSQSGLRGMELRGKTLGVIGTGRIGRRVIEIAKGFSMNVIATDVRPDLEAARALGFSYGSLGDVLTAADVLTIHVPATTETARLISDPEFSAMKPGAVLVNTSRGSVVDTAALVRALSAGRLRAVGLDVLPQETAIREEAEIFRIESAPPVDLKELVASHVLLHSDKVVVTPHTAYDTEEAVHRIIESTVANIETFAADAPTNVVNAPGREETQAPSGGGGQPS